MDEETMLSHSRNRAMDRVTTEIGIQLARMNKALCKGNTREVKKCYYRLITINKNLVSPWKLFSDACEYGNAEIAEWIYPTVPHGVIDVTAWVQIFYYACSERYLSLIDWIIDLPAFPMNSLDLNSMLQCLLRDTWNEIEDGGVEKKPNAKCVVDILMKRGIRVSLLRQECADWRLIMSTAAESGNLDYLKLLYKAGVPVSQFHPDLFTLACTHGHIHVAEFIRSIGVTIDNEEVEIAIALASEEGKIDAVKWLYAIYPDAFTKECIRWAVHDANKFKRINIVDWFVYTFAYCPVEGSDEYEYCKSLLDRYNDAAVKIARRVKRYLCVKRQYQDW